MGVCPSSCMGHKRNSPRRPYVSPHRYTPGDISSRDALIKAGVDRADSIILCQSSNLTSTDNEVKTLASVSILRKLREEALLAKCSSRAASLPLHIVTFSNCMDTAKAAQTLAERSLAPMTIGVLLPDQLVGGVLAQASTHSVWLCISAISKHHKIYHHGHYDTPFVGGGSARAQQSVPKDHLRLRGLRVLRTKSRCIHKFATTLQRACHCSTTQR